MIAIWDNRLSTGDAAIDAEHRLVLNLLNELDVAFSVRAPVTVVDTALQALARAVDLHVTGAMARGASPDGRHRAMANKVRRLLQDWRDGGHRPIERRTLSDLASRWMDHMERHDAALSASRYERLSSSNSGCHSGA